MSRGAADSGLKPKGSKSTFPLGGSAHPKVYGYGQGRALLATLVEGGGNSCEQEPILLLAERWGHGREWAVDDIVVLIVFLFLFQKAGMKRARGSGSRWCLFCLCVLCFVVGAWVLCWPLLSRKFWRSHKVKLSSIIKLAFWSNQLIKIGSVVQTLWGVSDQLLANVR